MPFVQIFLVESPALQARELYVYRFDGCRSRSDDVYGIIIVFLTVGFAPFIINDSKILWDTCSSG